MSTADYFERRRVRDFPNEDAAARDASEAMRLRGAVHCRLSMNGRRHEDGMDTRVIIIEGWRQFPADEGDLPL